MTRDLDIPGAGLRPLSDLDDYEVADGHVDVRGFDLRDERGGVIGEVEDLLVDPASGWVRYLVVELDEDAVAGMTNVDEVRVPVEAVDILADAEAVRLRRPIGRYAPGLVSADDADPDAGDTERPEPGREAARGGPAETPLSDPAAGRPGLVIQPGPGGDIVGTAPGGAAVPPEEPGSSDRERGLRIRRRA